MDREKAKKVPDARVQEALDELYDALDEIHKEINKLKKPQYTHSVGSNT